MGNVGHVVPTIYTFTGFGPKAARPCIVEFRDAARSKEVHAALIIAFKSLAMTAIDILTDTELRNRMRQGFELGHPKS